MNEDIRGERKIYNEENIKELISARQSVILYDAEASNPISIHISISQPSGSQFETVEEVLWSERRMGEINGREFTQGRARGEREREAPRQG